MKRGPKDVWRLLLAVSALLQLIAGAIHAAAFGSVEPVLSAGGMPAFVSAASKALWLGNSTNLFITAALFIAIAAGRVQPNAVLISIVAFAPLASAVLIYAYVGAFFGGHLMLAASALALCSAALVRTAPRRAYEGEQ